MLYRELVRLALLLVLLSGALAGLRIELRVEKSHAACCGEACDCGTTMPDVSCCASKADASAPRILSTCGCGDHELRISLVGAVPAVPTEVAAPTGPLPAASAAVGPFVEPCGTWPPPDSPPPRGRARLC